MKTLHDVLRESVNHLENNKKSLSSIIYWACPVVAFGDIEKSTVATLGLNPSNLEFVDTVGQELIKERRRFQTLTSLNINDWSEANSVHFSKILDGYRQYFSRNPYNSWFKRLDYVISATGSSYYFPSNNACHLDLVPYATYSKWSSLPTETRSVLLGHSESFLGNALNCSQIQLLILNGQTVVSTFEKMAGVKLNKTLMSEWSLSRPGKNISGFSYLGKVNSIGSIKLRRELLVLGYNHNIQSSFGVTRQVSESIRLWIKTSSENTL